MKINFFSLFLISMLLVNTLVHAASEGISKQQAVNIATQSYPGRVLAVKRKADVYQVKMLSDSGKVQVIRVDANSGKIKSGSQDNLKPHQ